MTRSDLVGDFQERLQRELGGVYVINRELQGGGMARVFLAEEIRLGRKVVIKVVAPDLAEGISAERFAREIRLAAGLQQANIVPVFTAGQIAGGAYYTMPYIAGASLRETVGAGAPPIPVGFSILRDVLRALAYAHGAGVVHRDIKPENVLLSGDTAVVTDFGIAKALVASRNETATNLTQIGTAIGTPAYMAPEQAAGDDVDHRADLYAWGILAYELLSGQHPFSGCTSARAYFAAHMSETPEPLATRRPDVPSALARVISRTLEKDPVKRPVSARAMLAEMDSVVTPSTSSHARAPVRPTVIEKSFKVSDDVCRRLDRSLLDPRIIGGEMQWLDNARTSDVLVVCIHGTGLDAEMFRETLPMLPHRAIAPTFYGFEPHTKRRVPLTLDAHLALLRELIASVVADIKPARTILVGFSSGGDAIMRLASAVETTFPVDAVLALGVNLAAETTWLTRRLARVQSVNEEGLVLDLKAMSQTAGTVHEWLNVHEYVVRVLRKFQSDVEPLRVVASGFSRPFEEGDHDVFPAWYRAVSARVPVVICSAEDTELCRQLIGDIRLRQVESGVLGDRYRDDSLVVEPETDHFDLIQPDRVARTIETALARLKV